ncbi:MAG TPA: type II toxin-antitoxin system PemK/MazF family toxin [Pyrinomonadaceae bacterium]|nr:type II toxin-antitoxin system PemK/MazF family toxin [Pyrinomonadaceae bacterium]
MVVYRGEIWWADLPTPVGSGPGYRRPVLVVQSDRFNASAIGTVVIAAITGNMTIGAAKGNVSLTPRQSGLPKDSVINVSQILTIDRSLLIERINTIPHKKMIQVDEGLKLVLDLGD